MNCDNWGFYYDVEEICFNIKIFFLFYYYNIMKSLVKDWELCFEEIWCEFC